METNIVQGDSKPRWLGSMFIFYVATLLFFAIGAITTPQLGWYQTLLVPGWLPSELWIAAIWCLLFIFTTISMSLFWEKPVAGKESLMIAWSYMVNAALVIIWNYLFFGIHSIQAAFAASVVVGLSVVFIMIRVKRVSPASALLLVPYLLWVAIAIYIQYAIMVLNP
jgi:tryptophan-rich sensory protein